MTGRGRRFFTALAVATSFAVLTGPVRGATIQVTTLAQGVADDGECSLQEAIYAANFDFGVAPASFIPLQMFDTGCSPGSGADVVELQAGQVYTMTSILDDPYNPAGPTATPVILSDITIEANGAQLVRPNPGRDFTAPNFRAFVVVRKEFADPDGDLPIAGDGIGRLTIRNAVIKGFTARGGNGAAGGGGGLGAGGGIYVARGFLLVDRSTFEDNGAGGGNGSTGNFGGGGGGGGLAGHGGDTTHGGGGGGGVRGDGASGMSHDAACDTAFGGGGGGTISAGGGGVSAFGGYRCGGHGGNSVLAVIRDGAAGTCAGGGGGGGMEASACLLQIFGGDGGDGAYGGGGGGGAFRVESGNGGDGGFGGGGGAGNTSGSNVNGVGPSGGDGGFGAGGGAGAGGYLTGGPGTGGSFAGNGSMTGGGAGAGLGGAIFSDFGDVTIQNSTFKGNYVVRGLAGPGAGAARDEGGALFAVDGSMTVLNSTLAANESTGEGAGIVVYRSSRDDMFARFTLRNSIIAVSSPAVRECFYLNEVVAQGEGNLIMNNSVAGSSFEDPHACPGHVVSGHPLLGTLKINPPGLTPTMALAPTSPALDIAGPNSLPEDQRGVARPKGPGSDIGAFEAGNAAPTALCKNVTTSAGPTCTADVSIDNGSFDPDGDAITLAQAPAGPYGIGTRTVTLTATDGEGASGNCTGDVTVVDDVPPAVSASLQVSTLSPSRNHDPVLVGLRATATDGCSAAPTSFQVQVFGDEDDPTPTEGSTVFSPDASEMAVGTLRLRAERVDSGDGRVYLIVVRGTDGAGNSAAACATVAVPHDSSAGSLASAHAQAATARTYCETHGGAAPAGYFVVGDGPSVGPRKK